MGLFDSVTPPPTREDKDNAEKAMQGARFLMDMLIESEQCPAEMKVEISILRTMSNITDKLHQLVAPIGERDASISFADKKALLEYLLLVESGIEQYKITKTEE